MKQVDFQRSMTLIPRRYFVQRFGSFLEQILNCSPQFIPQIISEFENISPSFSSFTFSLTKNTFNRARNNNTTVVRVVTKLQYYLRTSP